MKINTKKQLAVFGGLVALYALLALLAYLVIPFEQLSGNQQMPPQALAIPKWQLGLMNAGFVLAVYGLLGLAGFWFARKLDLPAIFREGAGLKVWFVQPLLLGLGMGLVLVVVDYALAASGLSIKFPHPAFPFSIIASATAGIGEEILFRLFVMGLWAFLFNWLLRKWQGRRAALWIGNIIAALAFSASHIPAVMILMGFSSPAQIPAGILVEIILLNSFVGLVAGERAIRDGLVAAIGIHFWTDIVWHVIWPLMGI